jgi:NAD(P)-dependent dehydrogenase (short-subunit alcohol dehydrogenase family)
MTIDLTDKTVVVTGGSSGIGQAFASTTSLSTWTGTHAADAAPLAARHGRKNCCAELIGRTISTTGSYAVSTSAHCQPPPRAL